MSVTVFGSINMDIVLRVATLPRPGETVAAASATRHPGGKGANQAVAAARFGATTRLIGAVGDDAFGAAMLDFLAGAGVAVNQVARHPGPTGLAYVFVADAGENQIVILAGANADVAAPVVWEPCGGREICVVQLEVPMAATAAVLSLARGAGALTILNTAPALAIPDTMLGDADIVVLNETELSFYLGSPAVGDPDAAVEAARGLLRRDGQWVVVTLGSAGIVAVTQGAAIAVPAPQVAVVDTTGAGDTFCGVLAASLAEGALMPAALRLACAAASLSVQRVGAAPSMPDRAEVEAALAAGGVTR